MGLVLVVPGRCEKELFQAVLPREFPSIVHQVVNAKGDTNVIKEAPKTVRRLHVDGHVAVFMRDLDEYPCRTALRNAFDTLIDRKNIVITYRSLEAWYLADEEAINLFLTRRSKRYVAIKDTDKIGDPQVEIKRLLKENGNPKGSQYEKTDFAVGFARHFSIRRAAQRSSSAARFLRRLEQP